MRQNFTRLMFAAFLPLAAYGQTIVSTTPENKKIILEEFTGVNCVYCPQGHTIAKAIQTNNPGNAFVINIHQGSFATPSGSQPDFRTPFGNAIVNQSYSGGGFGYPSGTVNRHNFPGLEMTADGTTAMGRGEWTAAANQVVTMPSYVNMAVEAKIDVNTNLLTVHVEAYYTGSSPASTNFLNVALLQNNTLGPQTGGNQGNNYNHMHRLVHLVTGQWGDEIQTTTTGSFVDKTYTYTIPVDYNGISAEVGEMEIVVFMTETQQEIISGNGAYPSFTGIDHANDIAVSDIKDIPVQCGGTVAPQVEIQNRGQNTITSATITYSVNGGTSQSFVWTGELLTLKKAVVDLPGVDYNIQDVNTVSISVAADDNTENNAMTAEFNESAVTSSSLVLTLSTDQYGSETRWNIKDSAGATVQQGQGYGNNQTFTIDINLPSTDCYTFNLIDSYGDGGGAVSLVDNGGVEVYSSTGNYGTGAAVNFKNGQLGVSDANLSQVAIYPNPSTGIINIDAKNASSIDVFDMTGKRVYTKSNASQLTSIDLSGYGKGIFVVKISDGKNVTTKKVVIK